MKLRTKLIIPVFSILILLGLITGLFTRGMLSEIVNYVYDLSKERADIQVQRDAEAAINTINNDIRRIGEKALEQTVIFAGYPGVLEAYKLAHTGNINDEADPVVRKARNMLKDAIQPIIPAYTKITGRRDLRLHFHLSNNRSFARVWRTGWQAKRNGKKVDISDDLSTFRHTVVQINQGDHSPIQGIEVGRGGFVIRGLIPIIGPEGKHYGSCEVYFSFNDILRLTEEDDSRFFAFYMDARLLETATSMKNNERYPVLENRYVLSSATKPTMTNPLISADFLDKAHAAQHAVTKDHYYITGAPIQDYLGTAVGVMVLVQDISPQMKVLAETRKSGTAAEYSLLWQITIGVIVALVLVFFLFSVLLRKVVLKPLETCLNFADRISDGDLTIQLDINKKDEIGQLVEAFRKIVRSFSNLVRHISGDIVQLSSNSNELTSIAQQVMSGADMAAEKAQAVASATEESSANINTIAAASEEASTNLSETSQKMEDMNTTVNDIAQNAKRANAVSDQAVELVASASSKVDALGQAASEIGQVTVVIDSISAKTDLLALNATVEAARAGEAGKGFAVVANEIKALANRTANSTKEIQQKIKGIQESTDMTVTEIKQIEEVIGEVHDIIFSITASVEEQADTTGKISENMSHATVGVNEIAQNIAQSSIVSSEIANDISSVSDTTSSFSESSNQIADSAEDLAVIARDLKGVLSGFKTDSQEGSAVEDTGKEKKPARSVSPLMRWNNTFVVNISEIDEQHQRLLELINQLHAAMKLNKDKNEIGDVLNGLVDYTISHFTREEELMKRAGYENLDDHQEIHKYLIAQVSDFKKQFEAGDAMVSMELMDFLKDWLTNHIKGIDKQYAASIIEWQQKA